MHSELSLAFVSIINFSHKLISMCPAPLHVPGGPEPITPPEEQLQGGFNDLQLTPEHTATSGIIDVSEGTANSGIMDITEGLPLNAYASMISDGFSMQFVLGMDSACQCCPTFHSICTDV